MRPTFRKLEVKDIGDLEKLVGENVEGIEPGLRVIDSRLLLGQAAIDLVGLDTKGSLVLIALDFTADEGLLLRVMDAYSWCLEYPDTMRRLYPMAEVSQSRPPRILFIVERLTDSFMRRIKQLSFLEIDCLEFRHLEVNGASALYFDLVQRLRRADAAGDAAGRLESRRPEAPVAPPRPAPRVVPEPREAPPPSIEVAAPAVEPARPIAPEPSAVAPAQPVAPVVARTPASVTPASVAEPEAPVGPVDAPEPLTEPVSPLGARAAELFAEATAAVVEAPRVESAAPAVEPAEEPARPEAPFELSQEAARQAEPAAPLVEAASNPEWRALLNELGVEMPKPASALLAEPAPTATTHEEAEAVMVAQAPEAPAPAPVPAPEPAAAPAPVQKPAWAKPAAQPVVAPAPGRTYFFAQAVKTTPETPAAPAASAAPAPAPAAPPAPSPPAPKPAPAPGAQPQAGAPGPAPAAPPASAAAPAAETPAGLEALNFPKDGLSRQWLEFLNQLGATK